MCTTSKYHTDTNTYMLQNSHKSQNVGCARSSISGHHNETPAHQARLYHCSPPHYHHCCSPCCLVGTSTTAVSAAPFLPVWGAAMICLICKCNCGMEYRSKGLGAGSAMSCGARYISRIVLFCVTACVDGPVCVCFGANVCFDVQGCRSVGYGLSHHKYT